MEEVVKPKIRTICIDTLTQIQENEYMSDSKKPGHDKWKDYATSIHKFAIDLQNLGFEIILVLGPPGTGKSTGIKTLPTKTNIWYNCDNKNPVWQGGREEYGKKDNPIKPYHVIPKTYADIINHIEVGLKAGMFENEKFAILTGHLENYKEGNEQRVRLKTLGSLTNKMQIEAKFETVLYSKVESENGVTKYLLETENNGYNTARSPESMLEGKIPNDYDFVIKKLMEY